MLQTGAAKAFLNIALMVAGRFTGGGAQVAVVASAMMGTVNGSAVANAATVGAFTIPMMVKRGYPRSFAGGVESAASSGGQITPPVMGAGAFIMAEILGIPYFQIAKMAAVPALLFYVGIMMVVYFEAKKNKLARLTAADIPRWRDYWPELFMLLGPTAVLVALIVMMFTPRYAAFWALALNVGVFYALVFRPRKSDDAPTLRASLKQSNATILSGLIEGASTVATLAVLVAGAQIMVGTLGITGLPLKLSQLVLSLGITHLFPLLVAAMLIACILGGPLPTVPSYLITAAVIVPLFASFKVPAPAIHLFIFYYACFSGLTPPVFGPVYSSAIFAGAGLWETAWESIKCSFIGFLVPFVFVYNPEMLGVAGLGSALEVLGLGAVATLLASSAIVGFWSTRLSLLQRTLLLVAAALIIAPDAMLRIAGVALGVVAGGWAWFSGRHAASVAGGALRS
jgi:TRAP transporter 4TM/12TM fusion protein